jgi:D-glycero-D-manno-heptose 1,7-bisphosphate phosphatase
MASSELTRSEGMLDMNSCAVFLDRDGTLNKDSGYAFRYEDWEWLPGALLALKFLYLAGVRLVVTTNQSGVARGMFTKSDVEELHRKAERDLKNYGVERIYWYYCPHHPDFTGPCGCRKPQPGLLKEAALDLGISLADSYMIGDRPSDLEAGRNAGLRMSILVNTGPIKAEGDIPEGAKKAEDVLEAAKLILEDILFRKLQERGI